MGIGARRCGEQHVVRLLLILQIFSCLGDGGLPSEAPLREVDEFGELHHPAGRRADRQLARAAGVVERRQTLPVLSNVLLVVEGQQLSLTGTDLEVELVGRVTLEDSAEPGEITVPVIDGSQTQVRIPAGTQTAKQFRIKGKGMPVLRSREVGDLYIQVFVETPQNLTKRQRELLQEFDQSASPENHPESAGFFSKVRDFFGGAVRP